MSIAYILINSQNITARQFVLLGLVSCALLACVQAVAEKDQVDAGLEGAGAVEMAQNAKSDDFWTEARIAEALANPLPAQEIDPALAREFGIATKSMMKLGPPVNVDTRKYPYHAIGKLVFFSHDGKLGSCTAQFVAPKRNVLVTAAHCIVDAETGKWAQTVEFIRAAGGTGQERYKVVCKTRFLDYYKPKGWTKVAADIAIMETDRPYKGQLGMASITGGDVEAVGYPRKPGNSQLMYSVTGRMLAKSNRNRVQIMGENALIFGASGGAWIQENKMVGLNSTGYFAKDIVYSPLITKNVVQLYKVGSDGICVKGGHKVRSR